MTIRLVTPERAVKRAVANSNYQYRAWSPVMELAAKAARPGIFGLGERLVRWARTEINAR